MDKKIDMASVVERIFNLGKSAGEDLAMAEADNLEKQAIIDKMGREIYELEKKLTKQLEQKEQHLKSAENALAEKDLIITELKDGDIHINRLQECIDAEIKDEVEIPPCEQANFRPTTYYYGNGCSGICEAYVGPRCIKYKKELSYRLGDDRLPECKAEYGDKTRTLEGCR